MHTTLSALLAASIMCLVSAPAWAQRSQADADRIRAYIAQEMQKCYALPQAQIMPCTQDVQRRVGEMMGNNSAAPASGNKQAATRPVSAVLVYECNIPAFAATSTGSALSIWRASNGQLKWRDASTPYFAVARGNESDVRALKAFGTPGRGDVGYTFPDGVTMTITANGWTTTSRDQVHNKNSLYGNVSPQANTKPAECRMSSKQTTRTFNVPQ